MAGTESQRIIDLVHDLAGPAMTVKQCLPPKLQAQGITEKPLKNKGVSRKDVVDKIANREPLKRTEIVYAESILIPEMRPAIEVANDTYAVVDHAAWAILNDAAVKQRLETAIKATCRVENNGKLIGTGFLVAPDLVMTNRHVASDFVIGVGGAANIGFAPGADPAVNFQREFTRPDAGNTASIAVSSAVMMHPYFDIALLRLAQPAPPAPLTLAAVAAESAENTNIALIGYPDFNPQEEAGPQRSVIGDNFGVKRVQPGFARKSGTVRSYDKTVQSFGHDCSTLTGNSGSPVISLSSGKVIGVHFYGLLRKSNWAVLASDLACDPRMTAAGVTFDAHGATNTGVWDAWWTRADSLLIAAGGFTGPESVKKSKSVMTITIPITLKIDLKTGKVKASGKTSFKPAKQKRV
ncbi:MULTISPECIES: trypsin-like serine peptidase [Mesorhizobium]|uniref:Serine protease n=1 Tax=Mesorhizobium denitrificans TaxID=2294114 RepID=A0A371XJF4_9HYPH|nr:MULTISPECIES: serine protease [Mesorhizobium]RFC69341.1 serine protease [Mesorhizobium denitrificans]